MGNKGRCDESARYGIEKEMTIFAKIIRGELPAERVFENERILAIKDKYPAAPVHILIMPKKAIPSLQDVKGDDLPLIAEIVQVAQKLAEEFEIADGYRLLTNSGEEAGQTIFHLHFHLIGGRPLLHLG
jgi:diadenosine tetraphosphate (Ap4A) HIT family hydrolase